MKLLQPKAPCPCGRVVSNQAVSYGDCCARWHAGLAAGGPYAPHAELLMRSRYSAFVLEDAAYLLATWAPAKRPSSLEFEFGIKWLGLTIRDVCEGISSAGHQAEVEFVARCKPAQGPAVRMHERSRFVLEGGQWLYLDGDQLGAEAT